MFNKRGSKTFLVSVAILVVVVVVILAISGNFTGQATSEERTEQRLYLESEFDVPDDYLPFPKEISLSDFLELSTYHNPYDSAAYDDLIVCLEAKDWSLHKTNMGDLIGLQLSKLRNDVEDCNWKTENE